MSLALSCSTQSQQANRSAENSGAYQHAPSPSEGTGGTAPQGQTGQARGVVEQIDRARGTFTLVGDSSKSFQVTDGTDIFKNNSSATLDDVHPGDRVTAVYAAPAPGAQTLTVEHLRAWSSIRKGPGRRGP